MTATVTPFPTTRPQDPALQTALGELLELGLAVARVASRLARVEDTALDVIEAATTAATRLLASPPASLDDARRAGQDADTSEAARDAAVARVAVIAESFDRAARAIRRTVALQARLQSGRPFTDDQPLGTTPSGRTTPQTPPTRRAHPASDTDHPDRPESGDELGPATAEATLHDIRRDLSAAASNLTRWDELPARPAAAPAPHVQASTTGPAPSTRPDLSPPPAPDD